ncbi:MULTISPECIES: hypothetical protein [Pseudomonas]|uniref:hypothetical protein n=1 Tax=Pseudomonas TaxID=286 RepID=UPI000D6FE3C7|nr:MULTISPECIES: hypothetical protein [unclassified Pseudomonas]PWU26698.1 hypothetical protein DK254_29585 [Pseudomonas sp. RW407]
MKMVAFLALLLSIWAIAVVAAMMLRYTPAGGDAQYVFLWDRWENRVCLVSIGNPSRVICDLRSLWVDGQQGDGPTARRP